MSIQHLLQQLHSSGMTDAAIGDEIGAPQSIITRLRHGRHKSTSYERGMAIRDLFVRKITNPDDGLPEALRGQAKAEEAA